MPRRGAGQPWHRQRRRAVHWMHNPGVHSICVRHFADRQSAPDKLARTSGPAGPAAVNPRRENERDHRCRRPDRRFVSGNSRRRAGSLRPIHQEQVAMIKPNPRYAAGRVGRPGRERRRGPRQLGRQPDDTPPLGARNGRRAGGRLGRSDGGGPCRTLTSAQADQPRAHGTIAQAARRRRDEVQHRVRLGQSRQGPAGGP